MNYDSTGSYKATAAVIKGEAFWDPIEAYVIASDDADNISCSINNCEPGWQWKVIQFFHKSHRKSKIFGPSSAFDTAVRVLRCRAETPGA